MRTSFVVSVLLLLAFPLTRLAAQDFKAYQNYDFVPGDKILFEDDFRADQDGEFPAHWSLEKGAQAAAAQATLEVVRLPK